MFSDNNDVTGFVNPLSVSLKPSDRFLKACPIKYECRRLFVCLFELAYVKDLNDVSIIIQYPETLQSKDINDQNIDFFINNVKKFAFPFKSSLNETAPKAQNSSLVQFYTFAFTGSDRIRLYGFCRSAQNGSRVLCLVSHLPWHDVYINILNKISNVINEKESSVLNNLLEAIYEYELPEPDELVNIISHDGLEQIQFRCPDRRNIPSISENKNLQKFFAYFDLENQLKIFTALLLERRILIISRDIGNITSIALALEYLIYPLEWLHTFAPILPEDFNKLLFYQPFPYIYGIHPLVYQSLDPLQINETVIISVDDRKILNCDNDQLPKEIAKDIANKLKFFRNPQNDISRNKYDELLKSGPIGAFQHAVLEIIGNYHEYLYVDEKSQKYKVNDDLFYQEHDVLNAHKSEFFHEFRITQAFEEFVHDRADYLRDKRLSKNPKFYPVDYIEYLFEQFHRENKSLNRIFKKGFKNASDILRKQFKEQQAIKKLQNGTNEGSQTTNNQIPISSSASSNSFTNTAIDETSDAPLDLKVVTPELVRTKTPVVVFRTRTSNLPKKQTIDQIDSTTGLDKTIKPINDINNLILLSYSSRSSSTSSTSSISSSTINKQQQQINKESSNKNSYSRINVNLSTDPDLTKYLNNNSNNNKDQEQQEQLVDLYNNNNDNNDNPFANDRFIDQFTTTMTLKNDISIPPFDSLLIGNTITTLSPQLNNSNNNYQSIIDEFDPININNNNNNNTQITTVVQEPNQHQLNSYFTPKPFQQQQFSYQNQFQTQQKYYHQSPMSSLQPQPSATATTANRMNTTTTTNNNQIFNSYLSYSSAQPFYGYNQKPQQFGHHSVAYPITPNSKLQTSTITTQNTNNASNSSSSSNTQSTITPSLFDNNNSLI